MVIKDTKGKYELRVDEQRNIVYEDHNGLINEEDINRLHNDYVTKIGPKLNGKKWAKCSDLRKYKTSNVVDGIKMHMEWCTQNGLVTGAIIVDQTIVKMQMKRASKNAVEPTPFASLEEADKWLKGQGF